MTATLRTAGEVFAVIDSLDAAAFAALFTDAGRLVFANCAPLIGHVEIEKGTADFLATIAGLHHTIVHEWTMDSTTIVELDVTYDRLDGNTARIPVVSIWSRTPAGLIDDYRVYFDLEPVYA